MFKRLCLITSLSLVSTTALHADLSVEFREGAPKDRFVFTNIGDCTLDAPRISVDLSGSASGVIFDTTSTGKGVEVFQPFQVVTGAEYLTSDVSVLDGDQTVSLNLDQLGKGQAFAFTIDVDDTAGSREITVSGSELMGATVSMQTSNGNYTATFDDTSTAILKLADCPV